MLEMRVRMRMRDRCRVGVYIYRGSERETYSKEEVTYKENVDQNKGQNGIRLDLALV